jgi:NAD(P)-dependent dehydrogenase (short-subunit alcohol dehydrogenase family)
VKLDLQGRTAVVTGASRGIGRAIAVALAEAGAAVAVVSTRLAGSEDVARAIAERGGKAQGFECDVTRAESVHAPA